VFYLLSMPTLICQRVIFYSETDEAAFFRFADSITAVQRVEGFSDSILLHVSPRPSRQSLHDLIALFQRYRISRMSQLAAFVSDSNRAWFTDPKKFWHRKIFGSSASQPK
jgi:hypothetical protein